MATNGSIVTAVVQPASGEVFWSLSNGVLKPFFEGLLALFARKVGAGRERLVVLVLEGAGWHTEPGLAVPDGLRLVSLPRYSPDLQPAERLWRLIDEPLVNRHFASLAALDATVAQRCLLLKAERDTLNAHTGFHCWPKPIKPS
jgi:transposase